MGEGTVLVMSVILSVLTISIITLTVLLVRLQKKIHHFMLGKNAASLEDTVGELINKTITIEQRLESHQAGLEYIDERVKRSIRGYSLVRYNAFDDAGGEQSFASGLLDEHGDGYILSVIVNRNHVGVYAKKIAHNIPETSLTEEEQNALTLAIASINSISK